MKMVLYMYVLNNSLKCKSVHLNQIKGVRQQMNNYFYSETYHWNHEHQLHISKTK